MSKVTMKDIARISNVSINTVSKALNPNSKKISDSKRREIQELAKELGYVPNEYASSLASKNKKKVAFIQNNVEESNEFDTSTNIKLLYFLNTIAAENGMDLINIFAPPDKVNNPSFIFEKINSYNLSDVIIFGLNMDDMKLNKIADMQVNKILIDIPIMNKYSHFVSIDNYEAQKELTNAFIKEQKLSNVLYITGNLDSTVAIERMRGFISAAKSNKINYKIVEGNFSTNSANKISIKERAENYDSVMCSCDYALIGVMQYLKEKKIKMPLAGFDGIKSIENTDYTIYTVEQDIKGMSQVIIDMVKKNEYQNVLVDYEIKRL